MAEEQPKAAALEYHPLPTPGKISLAPTKSLANKRDPSLAYSPGIAYACSAIRDNPRRPRALRRARQSGRCGKQ